jgi:uncharacterized protein YndB with AHSA1/START domain
VRKAEPRATGGQPGGPAGTTEEEMSPVTATMSFHVEAPVERVFDFFTDPSRQQADFGPFKGMTIEELKQTKEGIGSHYTWSVKMLGVSMSGFDVVTDYVRNERLTEKSSNSMVGTWEYTFEPEGTGTKVTMEHRQRSLWSLPPLTYAVDYLVPRMSQSFMDFVRTELEREVTLPSQRKPARSSGRKPVTSH